MQIDKIKKDPKKDIIFKMIFGKEENKDILVDFLETILKIKIDKIELDGNKEIIDERENEKIGIVDIKAKINDGDIVDLEMQRNNTGDILIRTMYYGSGIYRNQIKSGDKYNKIKKVIVIDILGYIKYKEVEDYIIKIEQMSEKYPQIKMKDGIVMYVIELPKIRGKKFAVEDKLGMWLSFLNYEDEEMINMAITNYKEIMRAKEVLDKACLEEGVYDMLMRMEYAEFEKRCEETERREYEEDKKKFKKKQKKFIEDKKEFEDNKKEFEDNKKEFEEDKKELEDKQKELDREKIRLIINSIKLGLSPENVADIMNLSIEEVKNIIVKNKNK